MIEGLDKYHAHEALDRSEMLAQMIESNLLDHPYVKAHPEVYRRVSKAVAELYTAYQLIGAKHL